MVLEPGRLVGNWGQLEGSYHSTVLTTLTNSGPSSSDTGGGREMLCKWLEH